MYAPLGWPRDRAHLIVCHLAIGASGGRSINGPTVPVCIFFSPHRPLSLLLSPLLLPLSSSLSWRARDGASSQAPPSPCAYFSSHLSKLIEGDCAPRSQYVLESNFILSLAASWNRTFVPLLVANYSNLYGYCTDMSRGGFRGCSPLVGHKYRK